MAKAKHRTIVDFEGTTIAWEFCGAPFCARHADLKVPTDICANHPVTPKYILRLQDGTIRDTAK